MSEFLAEAAVAVIPDLTVFREILIRDLRVATRGVVAEVGVVAKGAATQGAAAAATTTRATEQIAGARAQLSEADRAATRSEALFEASVRKTELTERRAVVASNEISAARTKALAAIDAAVLAEDALAQARLAGVASVIRQREAEAGQAADREREAVGALNAARAERVLAGERARGAATAAADAAEIKRRQDFIARGAGSQALAAAGLRGAVLSANSAFLAGTVAALGFFAAVKSAADLESELNVFAVTTGATADQMTRVGEEARRLGADITLPGVAAGDAAQAFTELGKAGLSVEDSIAGARGVLQLATAAQIDNAQATVLAASALNAFGLEGAQAVHVADVLTNAANAAQGSISDMGLSLQQAAAVSRQVGVSFEDTVTFLTLLARNGIRGSDAGTSLRVAFTKLINPTAKARAVLEDLNVQLRDAQGNIRTEVFADFARAQENLSRAQQDANAGIVFGTDALRAYSIISREGLAAFDATRAQLDRQGSAAELAGARMAGLAGKAENLKNQLSAFGTTAGQVAVGPLGVLVDTLATAVNVVNSLGQGLAGTIGKVNSFISELDKATSIEIGGFDIGVKDFVGPLRAVRAGLQGVKVIQDEIAKNKAASTILETQVNLQELIADVNKVGGLEKLNEAVLRLKRFSVALHEGDEEQRKFGDDIDVFIKQLQEISVSPDIDPFELSIVVPPELLSGEPGRLAGEASKKAFLAALKFEPSDDFGFGAFVDSFTNQAKSGFAEAAAVARTEIEREQEKTRQSITAGNQALNVLQGQALGIQIQGGSQENQRLLENLKRQEAEQRRILESRQALLKPGQITSPAVREAQAALDTTLDQEQSIRDQMTSDVKSAADEATRKAREIQDARDDADQAVIDAITRRGRRFDTREITVEATKSLADNIKLARDRAAFLTKQIDIAKKSIQDDEVKTDALQDLRDDRRRQNTKIGELLRQQREAAAEVAAARAESIKAGLRLDISFQETRGNERGEIAARQRLIARLEKESQGVKRSTNKYKELRNQIAEERAAIEDLKGETDETSKEGTTAFELLKLAAETFNANAGNLIGGNQPFAGPTGFTADLAQFLKRQQPGAVAAGVRFPGKATDDVLVSSNTELIRVIRENTEAIRNAGGNASTGVRSSIPGAVGRSSVNMDKAYFDAVQARKVRESGI